MDARLKSGKNKIVPGEGAKKPKVIFIGEAPGKDEEKQGRPFVGRAGRLLRVAIEETGLKPKDYYITNVVKIRPSDENGGNRKPDKNEIKKFLPVLEKEIKARPKAVIVLLGDTAMKALLGKDFKISRHHGNFIARDNRVYFISYHPSAGIRFQKIKKIFKKDFKRLRKLA